MLPTLHTRAVAPATVELLKMLVQVPELSTFALAGGTALALYKGHRISIDLEWISIFLHYNNILIAHSLIFCTDYITRAVFAWHSFIGNIANNCFDMRKALIFKKIFCDFVSR
jgi:hypothetical protein